MQKLDGNSLISFHLLDDNSLIYYTLEESTLYLPVVWPIYKLIYWQLVNFVRDLNMQFEMGFDPLKNTFVIAIQMVSIIRQPMPKSIL